MNLRFLALLVYSIAQRRLRKALAQTEESIPTFTYAKDRKFGPGLRRAGLYADLGLAEATGGNFHGEIIKVNKDVHTPQGTTGMHRHDYDFQFNYVLKGEIRFGD